jgi:hypothetical protein
MAHREFQAAVIGSEYLFPFVAGGLNMRALLRKGSSKTDIVGHVAVREFPLQGPHLSREIMRFAKIA